MMHDNTLVQLQQKVLQKKQLEAKLDELRKQQREYDRNAISLRASFRKEQEDVEKLEGKSLANYFFQVIGKMDDKLDKERQEAYAAKVKLDAAENELAGIKQDIRDIQSQMADIRSAQEQYKELFEKKSAELKESDTPTGKQILEIEQKIATLEVQKKEIKEALFAGRSARGAAERILSELDDADNWNTWDMIGGGGIITHMAKYDHLNEAQNLVQELQSRLRRFKTELADIHINANLQVNIEGFLKFADYFFDSLFVDWTVGDRISQSRTSVASVKHQIDQMLVKLSNMESATEYEITNLKKWLDELVVKA